MKSESSMEMFVLTGEQAGARTLLSDNASLTISGGMDTDVVFRDSTIKDEKINLITKNSEVFLEVIAGDVEVHGQKVAVGKLIQVPEYAKIKIGETTFAYGKKLNATWRELLDYVTKIEMTQLSNSGLKRILRSNTSAYLLSITVFAILAVVLWFNINQQKSSPIDMSNIENIYSVLIENGFESLRVNMSENGQLVISGFLMTNKERSTVEVLVDEYKIPALIDLSTGDQLAMEVRELFRVNGIDVDAKTLREGTVLVTAEIKDKKKFNKVKAIASNEIVGLRELETEDVNGDKGSSTTVHPGSKNDAKRITMVVDGNPAYLVTADQSKYYVGAMLPTGYKIIDIAKQKVILEKEGQRTTLNF
jgi:type III secretion protein D